MSGIGLPPPAGSQYQMPAGEAAAMHGAYSEVLPDGSVAVAEISVPTAWSGRFTV